MLFVLFCFAMFCFEVGERFTVCAMRGPKKIQNQYVDAALLNRLKTSNKWSYQMILTHSSTAALKGGDFSRRHFGWKSGPQSYGLTLINKQKCHRTERGLRLHIHAVKHPPRSHIYLRLAFHNHSDDVLFRPFSSLPVPKRPVPIRPDVNTQCHFALSRQSSYNAEHLIIIKYLQL